MIRGRVLRLIVLYSLLVAVVLTMLIPLMWMISTSVKTKSEVTFQGGGWLPKKWRWDNFGQVFKRTNFSLNYWNSTFVTLVVTFGQVATSAMAGFAFSRLHWPGRDKVFLAYLATLMIPSTVTMLPDFIILRELGWLDTYRALALPGIFTAFGTFLCRQYMLGLPRDLEEAAMIDGCGYLRIFLNVTVPLSYPVLATLGILTFMGIWRCFDWPLVVTFTEDMRVLPIALYTFQGQIDVEYNLLMAASLLMILPLIILFVFGQKIFVEGIRLGAVKG